MQNHERPMQGQHVNRYLKNEIVAVPLSVLAHLCSQVMPLWAKQVEVAGQITQIEIEDLSKSFIALSKQIDTTLQTTAQQDDLFQWIKSSQMQLTNALYLLQPCITTENLTNINHVQQSIEQLITQLETKASQLMQSANEMQQMNQHAKDEISNVLVSLQFQDRVTQILGHVADDISKLHDRIVNGTEIDSQLWLDELASTYTTQLQHLIHQGLPYEVISNKLAEVSNLNSNHNTGSDEVSFF